MLEVTKINKIQIIIYVYHSCCPCIRLHTDTYDRPCCRWDMYHYFDIDRDLNRRVKLFWFLYKAQLLKDEALWILKINILLPVSQLAPVYPLGHVHE